MTSPTDWAVWSRFDDAWMAVDFGDYDYCREGARRRNAAAEQFDCPPDFTVGPAEPRPGRLGRMGLAKPHTANNVDSGTGYDLGCRCDRCREVNTARGRSQRERRAAERIEINGRLIHPTAPSHGAATYSNYLCRCDTCVDAGSRRNAHIRARRKARS